MKRSTERCVKCDHAVDRYWSVPYNPAGRSNAPPRSAGMEAWKQYVELTYFYVCEPCYDKYYKKKLERFYATHD